MIKNVIEIYIVFVKNTLNNENIIYMHCKNNHNTNNINNILIVSTTGISSFGLVDVEGH